MSLFFWVQEYGGLFATTDKINSLLIRRFNEKRIEIPFPVRTVKLEKME
jgi:small-conductance mechanosensitive channel